MRDTMTLRGMYPDDIRKICELQEAVVIAVDRNKWNIFFGFRESQGKKG